MWLHVPNAGHCTKTICRHYVVGNWSPTYLFMAKWVRSKYVLGLYFCVLKIKWSKSYKNTKQIPKNPVFNGEFNYCNRIFKLRILSWHFWPSNRAINWLLLLKRYSSNSSSKQAIFRVKRLLSYLILSTLALGHEGIRMIVEISS